MKLTKDQLSKLIPQIHAYVYNICSRYPYWISKEDLFSAGCLGLCQAAYKFDKDHGRFEPFAWLRIKGAIKDELRKHSMVHARRGDRSPEIVSFDDIVEDEHGGMMPKFKVPFSDETQEREVYSSEIEHAVYAALEKLEKQQRMFIYMYFFMDMTQQEIANWAGVCDSWVSLQVKRGLRHMRVLLWSLRPGDL